MATCPLCSEAFDAAEPYRDHLEAAHDLHDDEGTATVTQIVPPRIEDDTATLVAEAMLDAPAPLAAAPVSSEPSPAAAGSPAPVAAAKPRRVPLDLAAGDRYPLATRHGDVALYGPGLALLLTALVRLEADVLGLLFLVLGTAMVVLGMLLPLVLGRR